MIPRSWLLVPGDNESKLVRAPESGAHAIIVDLADAVAPHNRPQARTLARDWLQAHRRQVLENRRISRWVRISAVDTGMWRDDLAAVMPAGPDGIVLPRAAGPEQVRQLAAELYELEQRFQVPNGSTRILPLVGETPAAALGITGYVDFSMPRLSGLSWGAETLAADIGATRARDKTGEWTDAFRFIRAQTLLVAHARGVWAIDTLHDNIRDGDHDGSGTLATANAARADGFTGMFASHAAQIPLINAAFAPTSAELAEAHAIVGAFAANPYSDRLQVNGRMIDQPHLKLAKARLGLN